MHVEKAVEHWADDLDNSFNEGLLTTQQVQTIASEVKELIDGDTALGLSAFARLCGMLDPDVLDEFIVMLEDISEPS